MSAECKRELLAIHGEADMSVAEELEDELGEVIDETPVVIVDLRRGASRFHGARRSAPRAEALESGGRAVANRRRSRGDSTDIRAPLLDRVFDLDASREQALAATALSS